MTCLNLGIERIKILRIYTPYNKKFKEENNFCDTIKDIYKNIKFSQIK